MIASKVNYNVKWWVSEGVDLVIQKRNPIGGGARKADVMVGVREVLEAARSRIRDWYGGMTGRMSPRLG